MSQRRSTSKHSSYDAIIVGGGHNGLACAAYLATHFAKKKKAWR